ncbi:cytochrome P450 9e2-like [Harpegnathos saltator]|nr:cytochrome P450 9e2-like [Harpegnathos saltator]
MVYAIGLSLIIGAFGLHYFFFKNLYLFKNYNIPYLKPWPLVGNMGQVVFGKKSVGESSKIMYDKYPGAKYIGIYDFLKPVIMIRDPELIKSIAIKHFDMFTDHRDFIQYDQDPLASQGLFFLRGDKWRKMRAILSPSYTSKKMRTMFKLISDYAVDFTDFLVQLPPEKRVLETKDIFTRYTIDVIATCAYGISINSMRDPKNLFYMSAKDVVISEIINVLKFAVTESLPWLARVIKLRIISEKITNFFRDLIETTVRTRIQKDIVRSDMLQLMMETRDGNKELTIDDIASQAFTFFFADNQTTSNLMCFAAHEIAENEKVQKRLQNEIDQMLEDTNGQVSYEAINNMEYLGAVLNEALRKYPIAPLLDRKCLLEFELPPTLTDAKPFTLKKGESVLVSVFGLHYDPKYFEEPEKFNPDRFVGEQKKHIDKIGAFLPFGLGPRKCIGYQFALMELKILLFHLLARCDLLPCKKTQLPLKFAKHSFFLKTEGELWLKVEPRENPHHTIVTKVANCTQDL